MAEHEPGRRIAGAARPRGRSAPPTRASHRTSTGTPVLTCRVRSTRRSARASSSSARTCRKSARSRRAAPATRCSRWRDEVRAHGVVTHSSGNHGAALAYAASRRGIPAHVVMPENAAKVKHRQRRAVSAPRCISARPTVAAREETCAEVAARDRRARSCIPIDDRARDRGAGHGRPGVARRTFPISMRSSRRSAAAACCRARAIARDGVRRAHRACYGAEPAAADDAARSFARAASSRCRTRTTIADGLRTTLSPRTLRAHARARRRDRHLQRRARSSPRCG